MVTKDKKAAESRVNLLPLFIIAGLIVVLGGAVWFFFLRGGPPSSEPPALTAEAKAYTKYLGLSDVEMKAHESFMQSTLVEITGKVTNKGERALRLVEINCVFYDPNGQVILRERVPIVKKTAAPLKQGETRTFRLPFDAIPEGWNQTLPQLVIAHMDFAE